MSPTPPTKRLLLAVAYALTACATLTAACSSRSVPQPASTPAPDNVLQATTALPPRPNITFPIFNCPPTYAAWYCLNDATCFTVEIHNEILYNCECALGYMGPRCEYKEVDGSYLPTRNRVMLEKASIVSGATLALLFVVMCCIMWYVRYEKQHKLHDSVEDDEEQCHREAVCENLGMDVVDGLTTTTTTASALPMRRPFGPHHGRIKTLEQTYYEALANKQPLR